MFIEGQNVIEGIGCHTGKMEMVEKVGARSGIVGDNLF